MLAVTSPPLSLTTLELPTHTPPSLPTHPFNPWRERKRLAGWLYLKASFDKPVSLSLALAQIACYHREQKLSDETCEARRPLIEQREVVLWEQLTENEFDSGDEDMWVHFLISLLSQVVRVVRFLNNLLSRLLAGSIELCFAMT